MDGTSDINCQQHDRLRNRLSHVSVWLYSSKSNLHLCIRIQHPVLGQNDSYLPDPPAMGVGTTETTMVNAPYTPIVSERGFFVNRKNYHIIAATRERDYESESHTVQADTGYFASGWAWISFPNCPALIKPSIDRPESERSTKSGPRVGHPCRMSWSLKVRGITPPDT